MARIIRAGEVAQYNKKGNLTILRHKGKRHKPKEAFKTATVDRGKEFSCYVIIETDLGIPVYFFKKM